MAEAITMPKLGMDMTEGTFINWLKKVGDTIQAGEVIAEIETDKTTVEVESTVGGTITSLNVQPGDMVKVGAVIGYVGQPGEQPNGGKAPAPLAESRPQAAPELAPAQAPVPAPTPAVAHAKPQPVAVPAEGNGNLPGGVRASPLARNIAAQRGVDLRAVKGSGPGGRITKEDVEAYLTAAPAPAVPAGVEVAPAAMEIAIPATPFYGELPTGSDVEIIDTSNLRKRIGKRMTESKQHVPHFYVTVEMDVQALLDLRQELNAYVADESQKITVNDLVVKAVALTLRQFPNLNSHFYGDKIARHKRINIGMAVALPQGGLINVVCKDADKVALGAMAAHNREMIARARDGKIKPDDVSDSTFTVSNLGVYDVDQFAAVINPPEAGIVAVGTASKVPVVKPDGTLGVGMRMKATLSADHRVSDGAEGAMFLKALKDLIEHPMRLVI